ncbi:RNA polymerase sigma factor [Flexithrix dorotheae]|uniref:RNA polymerase sigma factor n=1 Tax=Flexithrix dorotheae TaxID=70993 RepID=UPI000380D8C5|nr:RNA polymerase sigma factor [Flexithrix dorotheae]
MTSPQLEQKFTSVITKHQGIIHKVCGMYCHHPEERKDLFQEIISQLWRSFPSFRGDSMVSTWMYRVALNTAISSFRKESKRKDKESINERIFQIPISKPNEDKEEKLKYLYKAIGLLSKVEKAIIMLYLEEHSYEEIAQITGITKTNVGVKINRIKSKLQRILKPMYDELR